MIKNTSGVAKHDRFCLQFAVKKGVQGRDFLAFRERRNFSSAELIVILNLKFEATGE
jgi:hypothetical protein